MTLTTQKYFLFGTCLSNLSGVARGGANSTMWHV